MKCSVGTQIEWIGISFEVNNNYLWERRRWWRSRPEPGHGSDGQARSSDQHVADVSGQIRFRSRCGATVEALGESTSVWAVTAERKPNEMGRQLVHVKRIAPALRCLLRWSIGGVKVDRNTGKPPEWFADRLTELDAKRCGAVIGRSDYTITWELLAILVAFKAWAKEGTHTRAAMKSDSLSVCRAFLKTYLRPLIDSRSWHPSRGN
eukprot:3151877-Amphidinium_carterae.2